jgi:polyisoprenoid-binding protein YceI
MKKILFPTLFVALFIMAFNTTPNTETQKDSSFKANQIQALKGETHKADLATSILTWKGFKPTGTHNGSLKLKEGAVKADKSGVISGSFVIDMSSIAVLDMPADSDGNVKLVGHLKSADFFDVEVFPTATYKFSKVETKGKQKYLKGDLTIKGITKPVSIPVTVTTVKETITLKAEPFIIDRTEYNIQYKSNKFFDNLKDKFINDEFEVGFEVKLKK